MFFKRRHAQPSERGQILVIVAGGLVVLLAMVGLVVDGGFAWGQQRHAQNAADAASEAGALLLAQNILGATNTDADVAAAVAASIAENEVDNPVSYYTDIDGTLLTPAGATTGSTSQAAIVGGGIIPDNTSGVKAVTQKQFETFLARVIGIVNLTTTTDATAVAGYTQDICPAANGCGVLPVTIPVNLITCDAGKPVTTDADNDKKPDHWPYFNVRVVIPLCGNGPGNVGWLDWTPTAGGTSELTAAIVNPSNPQIGLPSWNFMTSTGNVNSGDVEDAINYYAANRMPVQMPRFDSTCDEEPPLPNPNPDPGNEPCPIGHSPGNGQNNWYHLPTRGLVTFLFEYPRGAWITGNTSETRAACGDAVVQGGGTGCLIGEFIGFSGPGTVEAAGNGPPENSAVGVQLIR